MEVDLAGAASVKAALPEAVTVFLSPPSWEELERRLRGRGTESAEKIERRLETARAEMATRDDYDAVVVNDDLDRAVNDLVSLLVGPVSPRA